MRTNIEKFLAKFPTDATSWAKATDEIRDLSRTSREYLEDYDGVTVEPVNFKAIRNAAEWNTKGRASILANFEQMRPATQAAFYERFREWFEQPAPEEPEAMTREDLIQNIFDLHTQITSIEGYRTALKSRDDLVSHLAKQSDDMLEVIYTAFESMLESAKQ